MKDRLANRVRTSRKLEDRLNCLLALRDARSGQDAHNGWLEVSTVFNIVKSGKDTSIDREQEALEYLCDKGYVQFREDQTDFSELPVVKYRIVAHGQDLLDRVIEDDPGVAHH